MTIALDLEVTLAEAAVLARQAKAKATGQIYAGVSEKGEGADRHEADGRRVRRMTEGCGVIAPDAQHAVVERDARLGYYAERFDTVEANSTFYRLPDPELVARWVAGLPDDFVMHHWDDAAIGAAAGFGTTITLVGGIALVGRRDRAATRPLLEREERP